VTGILEAGIPASAVVQGSLKASRLHDLPHELLTPREARRRFPAITLPDDWEAVFQPDGGFLRPEAAIAAHLRAAVTLNAEMRLNCAVKSIEPTSGGVRLVAGDGTAVAAGAVVVSAGAWVGELFPELAPHLTLTRQVLGWFEPKDVSSVGLGRLPVFFFESDEDMVYGFPDFAGTGVKSASHRHGRRLARAGDARQDALAEDIRPVFEMLARCIPTAAGPVRAMKTCIYTSTQDQDFIVDRHPLHPQIVLASPCSGHGFKFASVVGEVLADLATTGETPHDIARFRLDRLGGALSSTK